MDYDHSPAPTAEIHRDQGRQIYPTRIPTQPLVACRDDEVLSAYFGLAYFGFGICDGRKEVVCVQSSCSVKKQIECKAVCPWPAKGHARNMGSTYKGKKCKTDLCK